VQGRVQIEFKMRGMEFGKDRLKSHKRQTVLFAARLGFEFVPTLTSTSRKHKVMDRTTYGYSLLILAKACSPVAYNGKRGRVSTASTTATS
jgi:hypothetical protein